LVWPLFRVRVAAVVVQTNVRKHGIACFELRDLASDFFNDSGDVTAQNHWECSLLMFGKHSRSDHPIDRIYAGRDHPNEDLIFLRFWSWRVFLLQNLGAAVLMHYNCFHGCLGRLRRRNAW
jgi:hypothetical protein